MNNETSNETSLPVLAAPKPSHHTIFQLAKATRRLRRMHKQASAIMKRGKFMGRDITPDGVRGLMRRVINAESGLRLVDAELSSRNVNGPAVRLAMPLKMQRSLGLLPAV